MKDKIMQKVPSYLSWYFDLDVEFVFDIEDGLNYIERHAVEYGDDGYDFCLNLIFKDIIKSLLTEKTSINTIVIPNTTGTYVTRTYGGIIEQLTKQNRIVGGFKDNYLLLPDDDYIIFDGADSSIFGDGYEDYYIKLHKKSMKRLLMVGFEHIEIAHTNPHANRKDEVGFFAVWGIRLFNFEKHFIFKK